MLKGKKRHFSMKQKCDRCRKEADSFTMSIFNTDWICTDCSDTEQRHPDFEKARAAELAAVKSGDYNYPGVGLPDDLRR